MRREGYILRVISGAEDGLDETASQLWPNDHEWGKEVVAVIDQLHTIGLSTRKTKTEGKSGKYETLDLVYFLKWSRVSYVDEEGILQNEVKERRLYEYMQKRLKDGSYELPSWAAVCKSRAFCYEEKMTHQQMADAFAVHLPKEDEQGAKTAYLPFRHKNTADEF